MSRIVPVSLALATLFGGCGSYSNLGGGYGVTQGGTQDMNHARELIDAGVIPSAADFTAEGLFSEHDMPIEGENCDAVLCPRAAAAHFRPVGEEDGRVLVQLGFGTKTTEANFERPQLNLAVAIDISGSMAGEKLVKSKQALKEIVEQMTSADKMSLVTYGSRAKVAQSLVSMDTKGKNKMLNAIDGLRSAGSTDMESGMSAAIDELQGEPTSAKRHSRVFLLTDAQPNVGVTSAGSFVKIARGAAADDIALTVWGVGLDLGSELVAEMSKVRGGNAYHFVDPKEMVVLIRDEFDRMVTPLAYDVAFRATSSNGLAIDQTWGAPLDPLAGDVSFGTSTLFLSTKNGGMGVTLLGELPEDQSRYGLRYDEMPQQLVSMSVSWEPADALERVEEVLDLDWAGGDAYSDENLAADDLGVFKMGALIDELTALEAGAAYCDDAVSQEAALALIAEAAARLTHRSGVLHEAQLLIERDLMDALWVNVEGGETNCSLSADVYGE